MKLPNRFLLILLGLGLQWFGQDAMAARSCYFTGFNGAVMRSVSYKFSGPASLSLTGQEATGAVLWTSSPVVGDAIANISCLGQGTSGLTDYWGTTSTTVGGYNVMPTNVSGIGYSIAWQDAGMNAGLKGYPDNNWVTTNRGNTTTAILRFVRIAGNVPAGATLSMRGGASSFTTWYVGDARLPFANFSVNDVPVNGRSVNCTFTVNNAPSATIDFGRINLNNLPINVSQNTKTVNVQVANCNPAAITFRLTPRSDVQIVGGNCDGKLSNGSSVPGGAKGIGYYVTINDTGRPACWNQDFTMAPLGNDVSSFRYNLPISLMRFTNNATPGLMGGGMVLTGTFQ